MLLSMFLSYLSMTVLFITGIFMIIIILLQRGRGGGLAGAFGGLGGQSAFGTKAGDVFTKITIGLAVFWVVLAGLSGLALERDSDRRYRPDAGEETIESPVDVDPVNGLPKINEKSDEKSATSEEKKSDEKKSDEKPGEKAAETKPAEGEKTAPATPPAETKAPEKSGEGAATPPVEEKKPAEKTDAGKPAEPPATK